MPFFYCVALFLFVPFLIKLFQHSTSISMVLLWCSFPIHHACPSIFLPNATKVVLTSRNFYLSQIYCPQYSSRAKQQKYRYLLPLKKQNCEVIWIICVLEEISEGFWGDFWEIREPGNPETPMQDSCVTAYFYVSGTNSLVEIIQDSTSVMDDYYAMLFVSLIPIRTPPRYGLPDWFLPPPHYQKLERLLLLIYLHPA